MVETTLQSRHSGTCVSVELQYGCARGGDGYSALVPAICGGMAEWLKALAWNACRLVRVSWVRIPLPPPPPILSILAIFVALTSNGRCRAALVRRAHVTGNPNSYITFWHPGVFGPPVPVGGGLSRALADVSQLDKFASCQERPAGVYSGTQITTSETYNLSDESNDDWQPQCELGVLCEERLFVLVAFQARPPA